MSAQDTGRRSVAGKLELLVEASATLLGSLQIDELLPAVLELGRKLNSAEACAIWQRQTIATGAWRLASALGLSKELSTRGRHSAGFGDLRRRPAGVYREYPEGPRPFRTAVRSTRRKESGALMIIPMKISGEESAALAFYYRRPHRFSATELRVAGALANLAASAMQTAELYQSQEQTRIAAERVRRRAAFLADASAVLASSLDYETTLATVAYLAIPHIADWCVVHTVEADGSLKQIAAHSDPRQGGLGPGRDRSVSPAAQCNHRSRRGGAHGQAGATVGDHRPHAESRGARRPTSGAAALHRLRLVHVRSAHGARQGAGDFKLRIDRSPRIATAPRNWPWRRTWRAAPPWQSTTRCSMPASSRNGRRSRRP